MKDLLKISGCDNVDRVGDVIFIHGLDGDARSTWHPKGRPEDFWPAWLGEDLPTVGVWSLGYKASSSAWTGGAMPLADRARKTLAVLETEKLGQKPLVLICHSLGGLLAKQILRHAQELGNTNWRKIAIQTKGIVFLSTPHYGANIINWLKRMRRFLRMTAAADELEAHDSGLRDLNAWYRSNSASLGIMTQVYYEKQPVAGVHIVNETSADPGVPEEIPIPMDDNHITICKPTSRDSLLHMRVKSFVERCVGTSEIESISLALRPHQVAPCRASPEISTPELNPFRTAGKLAHDDPTYCYRECDKEYELLLEKGYPFVCIYGRYEIGKSSLMEQARRILGSEWQFFGGGIADLRSENERLFIDNFFALFESIFGRIGSWATLGDCLREKPSVIFLDDLGELQSPGLRALVPRLHDLVYRHGVGPKLRVVGTVPGLIKLLFEERGLHNPKFSRIWQSVEVLPFLGAEADELFEKLTDFLPEEGRRIVRNCRNTIMVNVAYGDSPTIAGAAPRRLQCLYSKLFYAAEECRTPSHLLNLIQEEASYN